MISKRILVVVVSAMAVMALSAMMLISLTGCDEDCQEEGQICYRDEDEGPQCCDEYTCKYYASGAPSGDCQ